MVSSKQTFRYAKAAFLNLSPEKQERVIHACIDEFAESGFERASTNRIADRAGVAKGSLFQYFGTKEEMFYAIVGRLLDVYLFAVKERIPDLPADPLDRYMRFMEETIDYMGGDLKIFRAMARVQTERGEIAQKLRQMFEPLLVPLMQEFLLGVNVEQLAVPLQDFARFFGWLDAAIDQEIYGKIDDQTTPEQLKRMYRERIEIATRILRGGIYKR